MAVTRRTFLKSVGALGVAAWVGVGQLGRAAIAAVEGTTRARTLVRGTPGPGGYRQLVAGPAESHILRTDLGVEAAAGREACRSHVLSFVQFSDVHIVDHQSPLRVEWMDRLEDPPDAFPLVPGLLSSSHRPQEALTAHVSDAMIRAVNTVATGPVLGETFEFVIQTGDNSDNSQYNEIRWNIDLLDGETVTPDSGSPTQYEGVQDNDVLYYDVHYWHPDGTPAGKADDHFRADHGFPTVPGLIDAARQPFQAAGVDTEWYSVFGNHDGLTQGTVPQTAVFEAIAVGSLKINSLPLGLSQQDVLDALTGGDLAGLLNDLLGSSLVPVRTVTADPNRRLLDRTEVIAEHFTTSGSPVGHGYTQENLDTGNAYYWFDKGPIRCIVMDSVNNNAYADGSLDAPQFDWIKQVLADSAGKGVILFSHHTSGTMSNQIAIPPGGQVTGETLVEELLTHPNVIAWVNGHTHNNEIWAHTRADGSGGFWEINTASHIDFPQQARIIEIADNEDGTWSIFTTILDHAAPPGFDGDLSNPLSLAALAREISANDPQHPETDHIGTPADRNTELLVTSPLATVGACAVDDSDADAGTGDGDGGTGGDGDGDDGNGGDDGGTGGTTDGGGPGSGGEDRGGLLPGTGGPALSLLAGGAAAVAAGESIRRAAQLDAAVSAMPSHDD